MIDSEVLFRSGELGALALRNRVVMSPMTRSRALPGDIPSELQVQYYRQRASAGLIISEGVHPSADGKGYCRTPGIFCDAQVSAWSAVTDAVHAAGGRIVLQLMHAGRIASRLNKEEGAETLAPSAIPARGRIFTDQAGWVDYDPPRAMSIADVARTIDDFAAAARNAIHAGFDGVELHGTGGYLAAQFMATSTNARGDRYGGNARNRARFVIEVIEAMVGAVGADRVGLKIAPGNPLNDLVDEEPAESFGALLEAVARLGLSYLHVVRIAGASFDNIAFAHRHFAGQLILNGDFDRATAAQAIATGEGSAVSFGRNFIANPDLPERLRSGAPLADFDRETLYSPGARGYIDYPAMFSPAV